MPPLLASVFAQGLVKLPDFAWAMELPCRPDLALQMQTETETVMPLER